MSTAAVYRRRILRSLEGCRFGRPSLGLCLFEEGYCLDFFGLLIALPFLDRWAYEPHEMMEKWGIYLDGGGGYKSWLFESIVLCWGDWTKFVHMPWEYTHISSKVKRPDGTWTNKVYSYEEGPLRVVNGHGATMGGKEPDGRQLWVVPYKYTLRSGEVQERIATVYMDRMEWRRKFMRWCPWFAKVRIGLWIDFSDEVGEGTGSWKGGTVGCGWDIQPGETVEQAVCRMERERKFSR